MHSVNVMDIKYKSIYGVLFKQKNTVLTSTTPTRKHILTCYTKVRYWYGLCFTREKAPGFRTN